MGWWSIHFRNRSDNLRVYSLWTMATTKILNSSTAMITLNQFSNLQYHFRSESTESEREEHDEVDDAGGEVETPGHWGFCRVQSK